VVLGLSIHMLSCSHSSSDGDDDSPDPMPILSPGDSTPTPTPTPVVWHPTPRPWPTVLPRPTVRPRPTVSQCPGDIYNCSDFSSQAEAQRWFDRYYDNCGDVARLDGDNDGIACESLRGMAEDGSVVGKDYAK